MRTALAKRSSTLLASKSRALDWTIYTRSGYHRSAKFEWTTRNAPDTTESNLRISVPATASGPHELPGGRKVVDRWVVKDLAKAPVCEACGWGPTH
jgi:hypothetical protein